MSDRDGLSIDERIGSFQANRPALEWPDGTRMTEGQLRDLKTNPRYWRDRDRAYQNWVDQLYAAAYPGMTKRG